MEKELNVLNKAFEENKSFISCYHDDLSKKCEIIKKRYNDH